MASTAGRSPKPSALSTYLRETRGPLGAAALTLPLLVLHGIGSIVAVNVRNGADIVSVGLATAFAAFSLRGPLPFAVFYALVALVQLGIIAFLASKGRLSRRWALPFLAECMLYAVVTGTLSSWLTAELLGAVAGAVSALGPGGAVAALGDDPVGVVDSVLLSFGAGFHEELVFRLGGVGLLARAVGGPSWRERAGIVLAALALSSLLFSAAHHLVEPFALGVFVFRAAMGALFGALYLARGFAVAAWTHALYDIWVLLVML